MDRRAAAAGVLAVLVVAALLVALEPRPTRPDAAGPPAGGPGPPAAGRATPDLAPGEGGAVASAVSPARAAPQPASPGPVLGPDGVLPAAEEVDAAPSTRIVQLEVGHDGVRLLGSVLKPDLPFSPSRAGGAHSLVARDPAGRTCHVAFEAAGLLPGGVPVDERRPDGTWHRGDEGFAPRVPVLVKLPGTLAPPVRLEVRGPRGDLLGELTLVE